MKTKTSIYRRHFSFAYVLLAAVFLSLIFSTLENNLKISLKQFAQSK